MSREKQDLAFSGKLPRGCVIFGRTLWSLLAISQRRRMKRHSPEMVLQSHPSSFYPRASRSENPCVSHSQDLHPRSTGHGRLAPHNIHTSVEDHSEKDGHVLRFVSQGAVSASSHYHHMGHAGGLFLSCATHPSLPALWTHLRGCLCMYHQNNDLRTIILTESLGEPSVWRHPTIAPLVLYSQSHCATKWLITPPDGNQTLFGFVSQGIWTVGMPAIIVRPLCFYKRFWPMPIPLCFNRCCGTYPDSQRHPQEPTYPHGIHTPISMLVAPSFTARYLQRRHQFREYIIVSSIV